MTKPRRVIHSQSEIPDFANEDEERRFWEGVDLADELWQPLTAEERQRRGLPPARAVPDEQKQHPRRVTSSR